MTQNPHDAGPVADIVEDIAEMAAAKAHELARTEAALTAGGVDPEDPLTDPEVRRVAAEVSDENPFGVPGPPTSRWSPYRVGFFGGLGVLTAYAAVHALVIIRPVLVLLLVSFFLAAGLNPAVEFFIRKGASRGRAVGIVLVVVLLGFVGFLFAVVPPIADQTASLVDSAPKYLDDLNKNPRVRTLDERFHVVTRAKDFISSPDLATNAVGGVLGVGKVVFGAIFSAITVLTLTLYFMSSLPKMKESALPRRPPHSPGARRLARRRHPRPHRRLRRRGAQHRGLSPASPASSCCCPSACPTGGPRPRRHGHRPDPRDRRDHRRGHRQRHRLHRRRPTSASSSRSSTWSTSRSRTTCSTRAS